jgi:hypothetical protein
MRKSKQASDVHYKSEVKGAAQFGLIAEDVAEVNPDLVVCDENGDIYIVRYDAVNAMLLNEFLKRAPQSGGTRSDHSQTAESRLKHSQRASKK